MSSSFFKKDTSVDILTQYKAGYGQANGTFGELLQGILPNQKNFMVTLPINLFSYATFVPNSLTSEISIFPQSKQKSAIIAKLILTYYQINCGGTLTINSEIPEGKGLASSSADLVATAYALQDSFNLSLNAELIANFIAQIEPTDGVMYKGVTSFYYKEVKLKEYIGDLPSISIVGLDEGKYIDTLEYNKQEKIYTPFCALKYEYMLENLTKAIKMIDLQTLGQISTKSALMNQRHNYKSSLEFMINLCNNIKGLGVAVAHSGTFVGILLDPNAESFIEQKDSCCSAIKEYGKVAQIFNTLAFNEDNAVKIKFEIEAIDQVC